MHCPNCRTALPAGSRFCNACGAAIGGAAQPPSQPTQAFRTQMPGPAQPQRTQMPYGQPGYPLPGPQPAPQPGPQQFASAATERKKPIALLIGILALLLAGVVGACVVVANKRGSSVLGGKMAGLPTGSGVTQAASPDAPPSAPGVVGAPNSAPPNGAPITGAARRPDGSAPPVLMAPGQSGPRSASSVVVAPGVATPEAPPAVAAANGGMPAGPGALASPGGQPRPGPGLPASASPQPRDNSDLDAYLRWLQFVESERKKLADSAQNMATVMMVQGQAAQLRSFMDPEVDERQAQNDIQRQAHMAFMAYRNDALKFYANISRTKPRVPQDCQRLDAYFGQAMRIEDVLQNKLIRAMRDSDLMSALQVKNEISSIYAQLKQADDELGNVCRGRGVPQPFHVTGEQQTSSSDIIRGLGLFR